MGRLPGQRLGQHRAAGLVRALSYYVPEMNTEPLWEALARRHDRPDLHGPRSAHARGEGAGLDGRLEGPHRHAVRAVLRPDVPGRGGRRPDVAGAGRGARSRRQPAGSSASPTRAGVEVGARRRHRDRRPGPDLRDPRRGRHRQDRLDALRRPHAPCAPSAPRWSAAGSSIEDGRVTGQPGWGRQARPA